MCHCGREFILEKNIKIHFKSATPRCDFCRGKVPTVDVAGNIMEDLLNETPALEIVLEKQALPVAVVEEDKDAFEFELETVESEEERE